MSNPFLYPRTISIRRPVTVAASTHVGDRGYAAERGAADETVILSGKRASVQLSSGGKTPAGLPTDPGRPSARIFIPLSESVPMGAIREADIVVDDTGRRFKVSLAYWTQMGWTLSSTELVV